MPTAPSPTTQLIPARRLRPGSSRSSAAAPAAPWFALDAATTVELQRRLSVLLATTSLGFTALFGDVNQGKISAHEQALTQFLRDLTAAVAKATPTSTFTLTVSQPSRADRDDVLFRIELPISGDTRKDALLVSAHALLLTRFVSYHDVLQPDEAVLALVAQNPQGRTVLARADAKPGPALKMTAHWIISDVLGSLYQLLWR